MKHRLTPLHKRISKAARRTLFADRQIIVRSGGRISYIPVPRVAQISVLVIFAGVAGWIAYASYAYIRHDEIVAAKNARIDAKREAYSDLREQLAQSQRRFADLTASLEANHRSLISVVDHNRNLKRDLASLRNRLGEAVRERRTVEGEKLALARNLAETRERLSRTEGDKRALAERLEVTGASLAAANAVSSQARQDGRKLNDQVAELQDRLTTLRDSQATLVERMSETSRSEIVRLDRVLASTGLDSRRLLKARGLPVFAQGGPFEPAGDEKNGGGDFTVALSTVNGLMDHLDGLQQVIRELPLSAPLDYYYVASFYGPRTDPLNNKKAIHRGVDFGAKNRATIFAPAPGRVKYAGWKGRFGRFIEIDHGNGIVTRYGHLRRINVKRGQKVSYRDKLGQMGSSGRSTGPHLHYEILVNGKNVDPLKFLKAGKNVFKG